MKVLVACEYSGVVRDAFSAMGHEAWSCDLLPSESKGLHVTGDVLPLLKQGWDLMIAHPPCQYICSSGMHWTTRGLRDPQLTIDALEFVKTLMTAPIQRIAIENPVGIMSSRWRKPNQYVQPYFFGDQQRKKTGLWLKNLPCLEPTNIVEPELHITKGDGKTNPSWHWETRNLPHEERGKARSKTFQGLADAMASQWG